MIRLRALLALALVVLAGACNRHGGAATSQPRIVEVRVIDHSEGAADGERGAGALPGPADTEALAARVARRLTDEKLLPVALGAAPMARVDYRLAVDVRQLRMSSDGGPVLRAFVTARLLRVGGDPSEPPITSEAVADRAAKEGAPLDAAACRAHLEHAVDDVVGVLVGLARVHFGGLPELLSALDASDDDVAAEAIRVAALRKEKVAVPRLISMLKGDDARRRDRALGALVEIGDPRAVKPITELARFQDVSELPKVIDALGALGGSQSRAYLEFVVSAHDDSEMRQLAQAALARLERHVGDGEPEQHAAQK